jgi:hypothetical protein
MNNSIRHFYNSTKVKSVFILLTALFSLISVASLAIKQLSILSIEPNGKDKATIYEKRLGALRRELPAHEVMGYISDEEGSMSAEDANERYALTQYVLSPAVIEYTTDHRYIVGNFSRSLVDDGLLKRYPLTIVKDFGDGVILLKKRNE